MFKKFIVLALALASTSAFAQIELQTAEQPLPTCGGTVQITTSDQNASGGGEADQVNIVFREVQNCSNFSLEGTNFSDLNYTKKLQQRSDGTYGASFTIPKAILQETILQGGALYAAVHSNTDKHDDQIPLFLDASVDQNGNTHVGGGNAGPGSQPASPSGW